MKWFPTLPVVALVLSAAAHAASPLPAEVRTNGFALGSQSYTFKEFTFEEACAKTASAGMKTTELFPGQKISADLPDQKTGPGVSDAGLAAIKAILQKHKMHAVALGVIGIPKDDEGARKVFSFAKALDIKVINTESTDSIDTIEKMVKEFDIKVGYHNHPQNPNNPNYKVWDPKYILELTKDRDARIGACADVGHWANSGLSATESIRLLKGRVVSSHLKDVAKDSRACVRPGEGKVDVASALKALKEAGFDGPISIEHEANWKDNLEDVKSYVEFVKNLK